jgi:hypothetical protein
MNHRIRARLNPSFKVTKKKSKYNLLIQTSEAQFHLFLAVSFLEKKKKSYKQDRNYAEADRSHRMVWRSKRGAATKRASSGD